MKLALGESTVSVGGAVLVLAASVMLVIVPPVVWRDHDRPGLLTYMPVVTLFWALAMPALAFLCRDDLRVPWYVFSAVWILLVVGAGVAVAVLLARRNQARSGGDGAPRNPTAQEFRDHVLRGNRYDTWRKRRTTIFFAWLLTIVVLALIWNFMIARRGFSSFVSAVRGSGGEFLGLTRAQWLLFATALVAFFVLLVVLFATRRDRRTVYINFVLNPVFHPSPAEQSSATDKVSGGGPLGERTTDSREFVDEVAKKYENAARKCNIRFVVREKETEALQGAKAAHDVSVSVAADGIYGEVVVEKPHLDGFLRGILRDC